MMDGEQSVTSSEAPSAPSSDQGSSSNQTTTSTESSSRESETSTETSQPQEKSGDQKPEGWNQVDLTPEQQKRFNRVFKELKDYQRETNDLRGVAKQQFEIINELRAGQNQIVSHLQNTNYTDVENQIKTQKKQALDRGDMDAYDSFTEKLNDIKIERKLQEKQAKAQPQVQQQQQQPISSIDVVENAVQKGAISRSDAEVYNAWANELDDTGNLIRPWVNERDMRNTTAAYEGRAVFSNPSMQNKPFADKLREIDKRMGLAQRQANQSVMGAGNLTGNAKSSNVKMSPWAEDLAVKTQFAGKGKSRQDHIEAYRKQIAETKGARR